MTRTSRLATLWFAGIVSVCASLCAAARALPDTDLVARAIRYERDDTLPVTDFFRAPGVEHAEPGTLIRSEVFEGYALPAGVRATRIVYWSRSQLDHDTVASAVVIVPTRTPPAGGWPVLVWAHGTTGVARVCAPSLTKHVGYYTPELVKEGLARGFAVVAVDYSGLGAGTRHEYLWKVSNARDTIHAVPAARAAVKELAANWVAIGHSQGGQTVWGVAEEMATLKDPTYRGAVALAPAVDTKPLIESSNISRGNMFYPVYVAYGIKSVYPDFEIRAMLQTTGVDNFERVTTQGCWDLANALFHDVEPRSVVEPNWSRDPHVQQLLASNQVGEKPVAGPMFIGSGLADDAVPPGLVAARAAVLCKSGATVRYKAYPGDHETMMASSLQDQMQWIVDRFAGRAAPRSCPAP